MGTTGAAARAALGMAAFVAAFATAGCAGRGNGNAGGEKSEMREHTGDPGNAASNPRPNPAAPAGLPENLAFAADAIRVLASREGNWVFCPIGPLEVGAAMAAGAAGATREEMRSALHVGDAGLARTALAPSDSLDLELATSMWISPQAVLRPGYVTGVQRDFAAEMGRGFDETSVNAWVEDRTHGRIPKLLEPGSITPEMRLLLVNTAYFRGRWNVPFDTSATSPQPFHVNGSRTIEAPTMAKTASFGYSQTPDRQILALEYQGGEVVFLCVLPHEGTTPAALVSPWRADDLLALATETRTRPVEVHLPKFTMRWRADLIPMLKDLGIRAAFDANVADFSPMSAEPLHVGFFLQESTIELDESGTVATSATAGGMQLTAMPVETDPPVVFRADRPFLFLIVAPRARCVLFAGVVENPIAE